MTKTTRLGILFLILFFIPLASSLGQTIPERELVALGAGANFDITEFIDHLLARDAQSPLDILILPVSLTTNPESISSGEQQDLTSKAENIRLQVENSCLSRLLDPNLCLIRLAPVYTRSDLLSSEIVGLFQEFPKAILIPDGDPRITMQVIGGTVLEEFLFEAFQKNTVIAAAGESSSLLSIHMLAGYQPGYRNIQAYSFGAPEIWGSAERHGFIFGLPLAVIEPDIYSEANLGRLINALSQSDTPSLGIGFSADTSLSFSADQQLVYLDGASSALIFDIATYHAKESVQYTTCASNQAQCQPIISIRNVLIHAINENDTYNLNPAQATTFDPAQYIPRNLPSWTFPDEAGNIFVSGDITQIDGDQTLIRRFDELVAQKAAPVLIIAGGYPTTLYAYRVADYHAAMLNVPSETLILDDTWNLELPDFNQYAGIILATQDIKQIPSVILAEIERAWLAGEHLLIKEQAAAYFGQEYLSDHQIVPGIAYLPVAIEADLHSDAGWSRLIALSYFSPGHFALGLPPGAALEFSPESITVIGRNPAIILDLRNAILDNPTEQSISFFNGLIDVIAPGEEISLIDANAAVFPDQAPTPVLATPSPTNQVLSLFQSTATAGPTETPLPATATPTRTPRPTATPLVIPPPTNPSTTHWIVALGVLIVIIILFGILINRGRLR